MPTCLWFSDYEPAEWYPPEYHDFHKFNPEYFWDCNPKRVSEIELYEPPISRFSEQVGSYLASGLLRCQLAETECLLSDLVAAMPADILCLIYQMKCAQEAKQVAYAKSLAIVMAKEGFIFLPVKYYPCPDDADLQPIWGFFTDHMWWGHLRAMEEDACHVCWLVPLLQAVVLRCLVHYHVQLGLPLTDLYPLVVIELKQWSASVSDPRCICHAQGTWDWEQMCPMDADAPAGAGGAVGPAAGQAAAVAGQAAAAAGDALADEAMGEAEAEAEVEELDDGEEGQGQFFTGMPKSYIDQATATMRNLTETNKAMAASMNVLTETVTTLVSNHPLAAAAPAPSNPLDPKPGTMGSLMHKPDLYTGEDAKVDVRQWLKLVSRVGARLTAQELLALCVSSLRGRAAKLYEASLEGKEHTFTDVSALLIGNYGEKNPE